ncbi:type II toxin-antitoxin system RelE/ParE family toxin [Ruminiclostridium herbifermentans]|uniref:Type II toxin-antitoxin system RelE/ParE family toxin n=1 Tax=Ruminiclostridium herbifermentans TaxID=2488810 RepID=A0A4U7JGZ9_9FIRM|nr:type II toxin-antitoxin system RelE/ParE family toxin [Ruminiclostridium herbifermentans]QNU67378.1 type II toxin-antitoxin system RelE/ParE family toxin [Ruminiclostridium herbifermentans]
MTIMYKVTFSKEVAKTIIKYDKVTRDRIYSALNSLPKGDVKRMQGYDNPPYFRIRIGDIRALFIKDNARMEIFVFDIKTRGDIYKKNCLHEEKNTYST